MRKWRYIALSVLLLAPVYWQPRVQAGDLSSHIYNSWLIQLIETGRTQGLVIVSQTTNILFDLMLGGLFRLFGAELAQRISVSVAVLVFVWGAFRFVSVVGGRPACLFWRWPIWPTPCRWCGPSACWCTSGWRGGCRRARAFTLPRAGCWAWCCSRLWWGIRCPRAGRHSRSRWSPARTRSGFSTASITSSWWDCSSSGGCCS